MKEKTLIDICAFLNFELNDARLKCVLGYEDDRFRRMKKCLQHKLTENDLNSKKGSALARNIFTDHHRIWINSAIRKINRAIETRGLTNQGITDYENTPIQLAICT